MHVGHYLVELISYPRGPTRCRPTAVAAQVRAIVPVFSGICGLTSTRCRSCLCASSLGMQSVSFG